MTQEGEPIANIAANIAVGGIDGTLLGGSSGAATAITRTASIANCMKTNAFSRSNLTVHGSDLIAARDITGIGADVNIEAAQNRRHHDETHEVRQSGFTLGVSGGAIGAAITKYRSQYVRPRNVIRTIQKTIKITENNILDHNFTWVHCDSRSTDLQTFSAMMHEA